MLSLLILVTVLLWPRPLAAAPVAVHFTEGITRGFLLLRTVDGGLIASGDLGDLAKNATHYVFKPHPGPWLEFFAKLFGRMP